MPYGIRMKTIKDRYIIDDKINIYQCIQYISFKIFYFLIFMLFITYFPHLICIGHDVLSVLNSVLVIAT